MTVLVILFLIFLAVMYALRYLARRPDVMAHGLMWILTRRQRRAQKERERAARANAGNSYHGRQRAQQSAAYRYTGGREPIIPREYAQDVDYEEVTTARRVVEHIPTRVESQVSDAEWEEI